jgi:hypothetical protein
MICEQCGRGIHEGIALHRQNEPGELPAVWRCTECNRRPLDLEVRDITEAIEADNKRNREDA